MSRVLTTMPAATLALALLTGCGAETAPSAAPASGKTSPTTDPHGKRRQMEAMRADCMKQKGFKYIPNVPAPPKTVSEERRLELAGDYPAMLKYREKHGFGVYFALAYPDDPEEGIPDPISDPNMELAQSLSKTQYNARNAADNACYAAAFTALTGKKVSSMDDVSTQADTLYIKTKERLLDGDPQLVELAGDFGDCLKSKGYPVASLKPTAMTFNTWDIFEKERTAYLTKRTKSGEAQTFEAMRMSPDEARLHLPKEIKASLDDLECGKDFYAAFLPRDGKLLEETLNEYGEKDGLLPY
ncbi:hypothetical protein [Streptosporangium lutulentum]|uniref:Lipoprotein n=1 Tax=Streptosporangium lutulentum TaxID=1461250 RepID=A0ABT9QQA4_9ACTN|nr:hypothetical protein [Streptosporangium lutulentum]MDP9848948.1 hypothetical protein [Streptosporangium lutulentum]